NSVIYIILNFLLNFTRFAQPYETVNGTTDVKPTSDDTKRKKRSNMFPCLTHCREKGVPRFWLMALNNNDVTSEDNNSSSYHNIVEGDPLLEKSIRLMRARAMLLVRELGDISETTMARVLATAEGTESLNTRVSSKLMLFRNFEVKNASSLLVAELVVAAAVVAAAVVVNRVMKMKVRGLRKVEINDKAGGWVKD
ncbi:LOW QUALITY PROTEIN: hypothetical protein HID58_086510, partial [Brassica napus]